MLCNENEKLLLLFAQIGLYNNEQAFAELFRGQYAKLYRFSLQYVEAPETAEEIVNDIFIKLWKYRSHLHTVKNPESYLFIAVKNQSLNYIKQYSRFQVSAGEDFLSQLAATDCPQQTLEWKEVAFQLAQTVDALPEQCRTVFKLVKEEGVKPQQVAKILNLSVRTVETQLYRAVKRLHAVVDAMKKKSAKNFFPFVRTSFPLPAFTCVNRLSHGLRPLCVFGFKKFFLLAYGCGRSGVERAFARRRSPQQL